MRGATLTFSILLAVALQAPVPSAQTSAQSGRGQQPPGGPLLGRRGGPPQPQQQQSVEYFVGSWTFTYTGRESPVTAGPRSGTMTFSRRGTTNVLDVRSTGQIEGGGSFAELGSFEWNEAEKVMTITERLNGVEIVSAGNWASPLTIRAESRPVTAGGQTLRIRRMYSILSAQSFTVTEEMAIGDGPFQRLGAGQFSKTGK